MSGKDHTLKDFKEPFMEIDCSNCGRKGRYKVSRLIERWGADMSIRTYIASLGMTCPRYVRGGKWDRCGIGCQQLIYMFQGAPFSEDYRRRQAEGGEKK